MKSFTSVCALCCVYVLKCLLRNCDCLALLTALRDNERGELQSC